MMDRSLPCGPVLRPFLAEVRETGGFRHIDWGRLSIKVSGRPKNPMFGNLYEFKDDVAVVLESRNRVAICPNDRGESGYLLAVHLVLPVDFRGKCIRTADGLGRRMFCDYSVKYGCPDGMFRVMALVLIKECETAFLEDTACNIGRIKIAVTADSQGGLKMGFDKF